MDKTLIIFLVFVSVTQNFAVLSAKVPAGLSQQPGIENFINISNIYSGVVIGSVAPNGDYFRALERLTAKLIRNRATGEENDINAIFEPILRRVRRAVEVPFHTIALLGGESCAAERKTQDSADLEESLLAIIGALISADAGNYPILEPRIEKYQNKTTTGLLAMNRAMYNLLRSCTNGTGKELQALIESELDKVAGNLLTIADTLYLGAKIYGFVNFEESVTQENITTALRALRTLKHSSADEVILRDQRVYALFETISLERILNGTGITEIIYEIRLSQKKGIRELVDVIQLIFVELLKNFLNPSELLKLIGPDSSDLIYDAAANATESRLHRGLENYFTTVGIALPDSSINATAVNQSLPGLVKAFLEPYKIGINIARNGTPDCSDNRLAIRSSEDAQNLASKLTIQVLLDVLHSGQYSVELESVISRIGLLMQARAEEVNHHIFSTIDLVSQIICAKNTPSRDDIATLASNWNHAVVAAVNVVRSLYKGLLYAALADGCVN